MLTLIKMFFGAGLLILAFGGTLTAVPIGNNEMDFVMFIDWYGLQTKPAPAVAFATRNRIKDVEKWSRQDPDHKKTVLISESDARKIIDLTSGKAFATYKQDTKPSAGVQQYVIETENNRHVTYFAIGRSKATIKALNELRVGLNRNSLAALDSILESVKQWNTSVRQK